RPGVPGGVRLARGLDGEAPPDHLVRGLASGDRAAVARAPLRLGRVSRAARADVAAGRDPGPECGGDRSRPAADASLRPEAPALQPGLRLRLRHAGCRGTRRDPARPSLAPSPPGAEPGAPVPD